MPTAEALLYVNDASCLQLKHPDQMQWRFAALAEEGQNALVLRVAASGLTLKGQIVRTRMHPHAGCPIMQVRCGHAAHAHRNNPWTLEAGREGEGHQGVACWTRLLVVGPQPSGLNP